MQRRSTHAGGFFLILAILGGFIWGAMSGVPLFGAMVGTAVGTMVAVVVWLLDRRRA